MDLLVTPGPENRAILNRPHCLILEFGDLAEFFILLCDFADRSGYRLRALETMPAEEARSDDYSQPKFVI